MLIFCRRKDRFGAYNTAQPSQGSHWPVNGSSYCSNCATPPEDAPSGGNIGPRNGISEYYSLHRWKWAERHNLPQGKGCMAMVYRFRLFGDSRAAVTSWLPSHLPLDSVLPNQVMNLVPGMPADVIHVHGHNFTQNFKHHVHVLTRLFGCPPL